MTTIRLPKVPIGRLLHTVGKGVQPAAVPLLIVALCGFVFCSVLSGCGQGNQSLQASPNAANASELLSSCEEPKQWVLDVKGGKTDNEVVVTKQRGTFREGRGALEWRSIRKPNTYSLLATVADIRDMKVLEFDIWSREHTVVVVILTDKDGAAFNCPIDLGASTWRHMKLTADNFRLNDDSKVKKPALEPAALNSVVVFSDFGPTLAAYGPNIIRLDGLSVTRAALGTTTLPPVVANQTVVVANDGNFNGHVVIRNGGILRVNAKRFNFVGKIDVDDGTLEFNNCDLTLRGRFRHEIKLTAHKKSTIKFTDCSVSAPYMVSVDLKDKARLDLINTTFASNGLTVDMPSGTTAALNNATKSGEYVVQPGSHMSVTGSDGAMIWFNFGSDKQKCKISLPDGAQVKNFVLSGAPGMDVTISNSKNLLWGAVSGPKSDLTILNSKLYGFGITVTDGPKVEIKGVVNERPVDTLGGLILADRKLNLEGSSVRAWNFYAAGKGQINIKDSTFGEAMTFEGGRIDVEDSTCDGKGGYIGCNQKSEINLTNCMLQCPVVATDNSAVVLKHCTVHDSVSASGHAVVTATDTEITGNVSELGQGKVIRGK